MTPAFPCLLNAAAFQVDQIESWQMIKILEAACDTDILYGDMACSESPLDILFFSTHTEVERIFQRKMLSGTMTDMSCYCLQYPVAY